MWYIFYLYHVGTFIKKRTGEIENHELGNGKFNKVNSKLHFIT